MAAIPMDTDIGLSDNNVAFWAQHYIEAYVDLVQLVITNKSIQIAVFLVLCGVTHFRKELSANHSYMSEDTDDDDIISEESARIEAAARKALTSFYESAKAKANQYGGIRVRSGSASIVDGKICYHLDLVLPTEMLLTSFSYLPIETLLTLSVVSPRINSIIDRPLSDPSPCMFRELWKMRFGDLWATDEFRSAALCHSCTWNPMKPIRNTISPTGTWSSFFFDFDACWLDWCLVGHNRDPSIPVSGRNRSGSVDLMSNEAKTGRCLIGLYGSVYDIGDFLEFHPGSKETILDNAGGEATRLFEDVGHSNIAKNLMPSLLLLQAPPFLSKQTGMGSSVSMSGHKRQRKLMLCTSDLRVGKKARESALQSATKKFSSVSACQAQYGDTDSNMCESREEHVGLCRVFYDPFSNKWGCWWTCCNAVVSDLNS